MSTAELETNADYKSAAARLFAFKKHEGFAPVALHLYRTADGSILYARVRMHRPIAGGGHEKFVRPFWSDGANWKHGEPKQDGGKVLYGLADLAVHPGVPVFVAEGEQKADALTQIGAGRFVGVTSGSATSAGGADWSPLAGRRVLLWPDNDAPGMKYADEVAAKLGSYGCSVERVDVAAIGLPDSGDVMDWVEAFTAAHDRIPSADDVLTLPHSATASSQFAPARVPRPSALLIRASDITPEAIRWLWPSWIPEGKLTLLAGAPGTGKTTLAIALAAVISRGGKWPDGSVCGRPGDVLMWSGEDNPADTIVPRLMAAGADMHRIHIVTGCTGLHGEIQPFDPSSDIPLLAERLADMGGASMLIVDPIVSAVSGDAHRVNDVRRDLQALVDMAAGYRCAVLGISHFAKGTKGSSPAERVIGSQAFVALARVVLVAGKDESAERRILARAKSNIAPDDGGVSYTLELAQIDGFEASRVVWGEMIEGTAREILGDVERDDSAADDEKGERDEAIEFLRAVLSDGPVRVRDIKADATGAGHSWRTIERAKRELGAQARKLGVKEGWAWALPAEDRQGRHGEGEGHRSLFGGGLRLAWRSSPTTRVCDLPPSSSFPEGRQDRHGRESDGVGEAKPENVPNGTDPEDSI